jgi:dienelactone hydrolase
MRYHRLLAAFLVPLLALSLIVPGVDAQTASPAPQPAPPLQPETGPGGTEYSYDEVTNEHYGDPPNDFWVYEPATAVVAPLPLVLVFPGWGDTSVSPLEDWIHHLARRGAIVVFVNYQRGGESIPAEPGPVLAPTEQQNLRTTVAAVVAELERGAHAKPDLERVAIIGTSFGGTLSLLYAATAATGGLPVPKAIVDVQGGCAQCPDAHFTSLASVPSDTLVLVIAGGDDFHPLVGDDPKRMFDALTSIPDTNRDFVTIRSGDHGRPSLIADHGFYASYPLDALDWYGPWKLADALSACAFDGTQCEYALGNTPQQRFMGEWSDGVPVAEAVVSVAAL